MKPLTCIAVLVLFFSGLSSPARAQAERPSAMKLFPAETLAFARIAHGRESFDRFLRTGFGQMLNDPELRPFLDQTWQLAGDEFDAEASDQAGFVWQDLERLPKGEIAMGLVDRDLSEPGVLLLADFDDHQADADFFREKLEERWQTEGMVVERQDVDGDTLVVVRRGDNRDTSFGYLIKENCLIGSNDETLLRHVLDRWAGRTPIADVDAEMSGEDQQDTTEPPPGARSLAEKSHFIDILRECSTQLEEPPQVVFFIDIQGMLDATTRGNTGARVVLATFPALGLDGVLAAGGTVSFSTEKWDSLLHAHLLLGHPRSGVLTLLRFQQGDTTPPPFVPDDVYGYSTAYVDVPGVFGRLNQLVDKFRYEGAFRETIDENLSQRLGIDFEEEVINNLAGRLTLVTTYEEPTRLQGEQRVLAVTLVDSEQMKATLDAVAARFENVLEHREFAGEKYYAFAPRGLRDVPEDQRQFSPCVAVIGDTLLISTSTPVFENLIEAEQGTRSRLADSIEFLVIHSRIERLTRGRELALLNYGNIARAMAHWYELATGEQVREGLSTAAEESRIADEFLGILDNSDLPPFSTLEKYLTPNGGYLLNTDTGLHYMSFSLQHSSADEVGN